MFYTSIVLFFGFSVFAISSFGGTVALGTLVSATLLLAMLANLILLPSLLLSLERNIANKEVLKKPQIDILPKDEISDKELNKFYTHYKQNLFFTKRLYLLFKNRKLRMKSYSIKELLSQNLSLQEVTVNGWVKTFRSNRFIALNDGSTLNNIQCVVDFENFDEALLKKVSTGAALKIIGTLVESQGRGQTVEIQVKELVVLGISDPDTYPIQPKKHSLEFLREKAHLRVRTNTFAAVMRVRSALSFAIHSYFQKNGFYNVHTPIITGSDAEGAGSKKATINRRWSDRF